MEYNIRRLKKVIRTKCTLRAREIMKTGFNSENIKATIKTLAIADANYSFNIINWNLKKIDTNIHKQLTGNIIRHQEATDVRLYCQ